MSFHDLYDPSDFHDEPREAWDLEQINREVDGYYDDEEERREELPPCDLW